MRTFLKTTSASLRSGGLRLHAHARRRLAAGEEGFLLVEVMVSALLVALIVTATFNGFDVASRLSIDQRRHAQAQLLAAESQEQLRSDSATTLSALETASHSYAREISNNGSTTIYKITQEAKALSAKGKTGCSATGASKENGANIEIISTVTWAALETQTKKFGREPVRLASVITPPVGSALEVDVTDGGSPANPVSGVTALVSFKPVGASTSTVAEATTGSAGCVVFTGIAATTASVEIKEKVGYVIKTGELKYPTKTVTIAPNITTQYPVTYAPGGRLTAQFTYKGATTYSGKEVKGDTFVVSNSNIPAGTAQFAEGSVNLKIQESGELPYFAFGGVAKGFATGAPTATSTAYPNGDLFPFPSEWTGYAGECPKNLVTGFEGKASVVGGASSLIKIPLAYDQILLKTGNYANRGTASTDAGEYEAKVEFPECEGYELPNHSYGVDREHEQGTVGGELEYPFQPFGKVRLCIYNKAAEKAYTSEFTNLTETYTPKAPLYTGQGSKSERETREKEEATAKTAKEKRETEETAAKTAKEKREKEETEAKTAKEKRETEETAAKTAKEKRESEETAMTAAKVTREAKEKEERTKWEKERKEGKISTSTYESKLTAQTNARKTKESEEATARTKRATEEAAASTAKGKRVNEETAAKTAKQKRESEEAAAKTAKETREKEETEAKPAKEKREAEEKAAAEAGHTTKETEEKFEKETGFKVATGQKANPC